MNNDVLVGKFVFVPKHFGKRDCFMYLGMIYDGMMFLYDYDGNSERISVDALELREATKDEIAEDFCRNLGFNEDYNKLGGRKRDIINELNQIALDKCKKYCDNIDVF